MQQSVHGVEASLTVTSDYKHARGKSTGYMLHTSKGARENGKLGSTRHCTAGQHHIRLAGLLLRCHDCCGNSAGGVALDDALAGSNDLRGGGHGARGCRRKVSRRGRGQNRSRVAAGRDGRRARDRGDLDVRAHRVKRELVKGRVRGVAEGNGWYGNNRRVKGVEGSAADDGRKIADRPGVVEHGGVGHIVGHSVESAAHASDLVLPPVIYPDFHVEVAPRVADLGL